MSENVLKVGILQNGYEVECYEPAPKKPGTKKATYPEPWVDPWKSYAFKTPAEVQAFIAKKLPGLSTLQRMDFDEAFEEASKMK